MTRRTRRLLLTLAALLAVSLPALAFYSKASTPQPAAAAANSGCQATPGDQKLGGALLHVPPRPRKSQPLVLAFHGAGGSGAGFAVESGLSKTADAHGFAVLYPNAASARKFWSLSRSTGNVDVERVEALIPQALAAVCGDPKRVFATGVSNGGGFTARLGCETQLRAIAPVAGGYRSLDPCPDDRRTSVLEIHGTGDNVVPYEGLPPDYGGSALTYISGWGRRDGCKEHPARKREGRKIVHLRYVDCADGLAVEHFRLEDLDHGWPTRATGFDTNEAVWRFFSTR
jgi:polyhydroxybutyrate depolymerase